MDHKHAGISRRSFLTGAAATGALATLGLAGCAPQASGEAEPKAQAADNTAPAANDWLGSAPEVADADITETKECDILIVGAGMSGMAAAATAADLGLNFLVVDKGSEPAAPHFDVGAINSKFTEQTGESVDEGRILNELNRYASFKNDSTVAGTWIRQSSEMVEWLQALYEEKLGGCTVTVDVENGGDGRAGGTMYYIPPECHTFSDGEGGRINHIEVLTEFIADKGYEVGYSHDLVKLVRDGSGPVTGAIFTTPDGTVKINAAKGVVLATGGYPADPVMVQALNPIIPACVTSTNYNLNNTGMGIKAALWAGAAMDTTPAAMIFDRGSVEPGVDAGYTGEGADAQFATGGQFNLGSQPFLKVDRNGARITNESCNYDGICHAASNHPGGVWCQVFDVNAPEDVQRFKTQGCAAMTWKMQLKDKTVDEAYDEKYISTGIMQKADTLDELATKLGFEGDAKTQFLASIERYNELFDAGVDEDMGKEAYRLSEIRTAPFYGTWFGGSLLTTLDGVRINKDTQVLDTDEMPIEGLYAVGTCSGSYYSGNYPVYLVGNCLGRNMTFGRHAVRFIAGEVE
ncbi:FAD-binding protein [Raoultibacter phocaeensis]|uniref:FAD-binding protein n=1 Tax=Raoultibacter phocaeensis TaxID=2479841 RepID=UPI00111B0B3E|nr:FAD-binding protein [Raoultibacter phocaeensis]